MQSSYISPKDFQHQLEFNHKATRAVFSEDGQVCTYSSRDHLYQWLSPTTGEVLHEVKDQRLIGGQFALHQDQVYTTYYNRVFRISPDGTSVNLLADHEDDFAGIKGLQVTDGMLFVMAHRGLFVFSLADLSLLHAFRHSNGSGVGNIGSLYNPETGILYVSNLKDEKAGSMQTVAVDTRNQFSPLWTARLAGSHPDIRSNNRLNIIHETQSYLIVPHLEGSKSQITFLDKSNGEVVNSFKIYTNQAIIYGKEIMYIKEWTDGQMAAISYADQKVVWTSPIPSDCQGNFYLLKNRLVAACTGKRTHSIEALTGKGQTLALPFSVKPVWTPDLLHHPRYFLLGSQLCWDD